MQASFPGVHSDAQILGGAPVFVGTRVPVKALLDYIERGHSIDDFLDDFPSVERAQVIAVLDHVRHLVADATPAG